MLRSGALIFRSPFFSQGLVVKHGLFNILNVKIDCTISMTFQKAPKVNEHWVHVQNCSLLSGFHLFYRGIFQKPKFGGFLRTFSVTLLDWQCLPAIAQPFKISITDDVTSGWVVFFESSMEPWLRLNGNNFASLQLKERILVPTISTMTYSGKPQQKSKAKRSWKIWMEKIT